MSQNQTTIAPQPGIMEISLYEGGASKVAGVENVVKLSSNENPFGPSDKAREAVIRAAHGLHRYPNTDHAGLRGAIGEVHGLDPDRIICGVGSDEIIHFLCQAYAGPGTEVLFTEHGFLMYRISAHAAGAIPVQVAERDRVTDIDALIAGATPRTRLIFVANPNNPTGTMVGLPELERLARAVPQAILVVDAAYAEYVGDYDGGAELATRLPNVFMTRTFSKIYGLGGLRVGWGYGPREIVDVLNRIRGPFNLSNVALEGAEAAMRDREHIARCQAENARMRAWLAEALAEKGVPSDTSCANFILARFADAETAGACDEYLKTQGLIVRRVAGYGLPHCLRITIGDEASCRRVAHVIGQYMAERAESR
ncbi:histidinol-phosphate transaminase [Paracoccus denitrificans]|jgi:histidinol-phosphate aminotransferase|uniref:histidinol-phosphate transaminase n=1 Tax=Paracoccus denitrificans TaxID=266 RepID=UPI0008915A14|nr:histidinol-phosphate transaminase [Paracoccus denitrificans]MCU7427759.1 histidinol-phosphate transaminase [Paracoccus denitrificans]QAR25015.1 histidinol-phosphate transaminase [Paracoccus denitrificans]UPV93805.1 histidinol-phosphate transaminase [Paracoccus denitrificans]WQO34083.1 histidinol-phosphate transaminase [Paracoccus denitrificans]SDI07289.1 histidinol phosphate aminotransferase apoenzyme [Paracoccus denitrificans]